MTVLQYELFLRESFLPCNSLLCNCVRSAASSAGRSPNIGTVIPMAGYVMAAPTWRVKPQFAGWEVDHTRFEIKRLLGKGSYGSVAEAIDHLTGQRVAIKKVPGVFEVRRSEAEGQCSCREGIDGMCRNRGRHCARSLCAPAQMAGVQLARTLPRRHRRPLLCHTDLRELCAGFRERKAHLSGDPHPKTDGTSKCGETSSSASAKVSVCALECGAATMSFAVAPHDTPPYRLHLCTPGGDGRYVYPLCVPCVWCLIAPSYTASLPSRLDLQRPTGIQRHLHHFRVHGH